MVRFIKVRICSGRTSSIALLIIKQASADLWEIWFFITKLFIAMHSCLTHWNSCFQNVCDNMGEQRRRMLFSHQEIEYLKRHVSTSLTRINFSWYKRVRAAMVSEQFYAGLWWCSVHHSVPSHTMTLVERNRSLADQKCLANVFPWTGSTRTLIERR